LTPPLLEDEAAEDAEDDAANACGRYTMVRHAMNRNRTISLLSAKFAL
jgi:hypothetical protein